MIRALLRRLGEVTGYWLPVIRSTVQPITNNQQPKTRCRPGLTLIELLLFVAIFAVVAMSTIPLFFASTEDRLLQQTVSIVEQNGTQILQTIGASVRQSERVILPARQGTGTLLHLQTGSGTSNPTIIGVSSGALIMVQHTDRQVISSTQVAVSNFSVRNTSTSDSRPSIYVRFTLSRTIRLQAPRSYVKTFEGVFTLPPTDLPVGNACGCALPGCGDSQTYVWQVCEAGTCLTASTPLQCP